MPNWKKVIVSGSDAVLNDITASGTVTANSLVGTLGTAAQTNITSLGTLTSLTVDDITINGSTISDSGDLTLDIGGDLNIDVDGADIILKDGGTAFGRFKRDSSDFIIKSETNNEDIIFRGQDAGVTIDALTLDMSDAGSATFNNNITASGNISASGLIRARTLNITSIADGGATIGNNQILHEGIETTAANLTVGQATVATNVTAVATTDNAEFFVGVLDGASGNQVVETSARLKYNPSSGKLAITGDISSSSTVSGITGSFHALVGDTSQATSLEVDGHITASGNISSSGYVYSKNAQYWSTTGRLTTGNNTTNYYGPNPQGTNYYFWNRDLGTSSTTITAKTTTLNSGWKLPYKAVLTGYHLNIQGRSTTDNIEFTLVYSDGMWDGDVTSTSQTLVEAESGQTVTIAASNNFYELDRRGQFAIPVSAMTMLFPRFRKTVATGGTAYDFQLAVEYYVVQ